MSTCEEKTLTSSIRNTPISYGTISRSSFLACSPIWLPAGIVPSPRQLWTIGIGAGRVRDQDRPPTPIGFSIRKTGGGGGGSGRLCGCLGNWRWWWGILRRNRLSYKRRHGCCIERDKDTIFSRSIGLEKAKRLMKSKGSTTILHTWFGIFCSPVAPSSLLCAVVWDDLICQCDDMEEIGKGCKKELDLVPTWKSKDCKQRGR